ncbi:MAG: DinB family protein [Hymenobacteraceae bacterium]|nr:DinB family protein [Hymenobacteraceae bacterium]
MTALNQLLLTELDREALATRRMLERVPAEHFAWQPHAKSMTLGRLATHVAELPAFLNRILDADEFDMAVPRPAPLHAEDSAALLAFFEERLAAGRTALGLTPDEALHQPWTFRAGERVIAQDSKYQMIRHWMMNHQIHHRGQLSVYLRLLDVPVPGMYGPSADERPAPKPA